MEALVLTESRRIRNQLMDVLQKRGMTAKCVTASGEFMEALDESLPGRLVLDFDTWKKGRAMYSYFDVEQKIASVPTLFFNTPENFKGLAGRPLGEKDTFVPAPATIDTISEALQ